MITLLDYGAGNVRSVVNALESLGETVLQVASPADIDQAERLVFPGVGNFGAMMRSLKEQGLVEPLRRYLEADRPFFGICIAHRRPARLFTNLPMTDGPTGTQG